MRLFMIVYIKINGDTHEAQSYTFCALVVSKDQRVEPRGATYANLC